MFKLFSSSLMVGVLLALSGGLSAQQPQSFEGTSAAPYIANMREVDDDVSLVVASDLKDETVLRITYNNRTYIQHRPMPVEGGKSYRVSFMCRWVNDETLETNPSFEVMVGPASLSQVDVLPAASVDFYDEKNKLIASASTITLLHGKWQTYHMALLAPPQATSVRVKWMSGRNLGHLLVTRPRLEQLPSQGQAITLDFTQEKKDVSGSAYGLQLDHRIWQTEEGGLRLYTSSERTGDLYIGPPGRYRLRMEGSWRNRPSSAMVIFRTDANRQAGSHTIRQPLGEGEEFTLPDTASCLQIQLRDMFIHRIIIEPVK